MAVIQTPSGGMTVRDPSGYEVLRGGQGFSVRETEPGDIVIKKVYSTSGSSRSPTPSGPTPAQLEAQRLEQLRKAEALRKQQQEAKKLADAINKAKKEKIESGKISGQVSGKVNGQVTSRFQTLSTGGKPLSDPYYRTSAYGKKVAEVYKQSFEEAQARGRNLNPTEIQTLAGSVFGGGGEIERSKEILEKGLLTEAEEKQRLEYEIRKIQRKDEGKPLYTDEELKVLQAGENIKTLGGDTISPGLTGEANVPPKQSIISKSDIFIRKATDPIFGAIEKRIGIDITTPEGQNILSQSSLGVGSFGLKPSPKQDIISGATAGVLKDIKEKPTKNILIYGASYGFGFGISAVSSGVALGSAKLLTSSTPIISKFGGSAVKLTSLGLGGAYAYTVGKQILASEDLSSAGATLGVATKDIYLFGAGTKAGAKGFSYISGKPYTSNLTDIKKEKAPPGFAQEQSALDKSFQIAKPEKLNIQNIRWNRIQEIPKDVKTQKILERFIKEKKLIVGGTTAIETGGINLRRLPRDVEAYTSFNKVSKSSLYKELGGRLKAGGVKDFEVTKGGIIFGGKGHGFNLQDVRALNLERFRYKIYKTPKGTLVADPLSTAYNKVADLLKSAKLGTPKAKRIAAKLGTPELISKGTAGGRIYERYPKDVIGALSTARDITKKSLARYGDLSKKQIPIYQEYKQLRLGQAKELIKPYLGKLKYEEAPAVEYYYTGKQAGFFSGAKHIKSYTFKLQKDIFASKRGLSTLAPPTKQIKTSSQYFYLPSGKVVKPKTIYFNAKADYYKKPTTYKFNKPFIYDYKPVSKQTKYPFAYKQRGKPTKIFTPYKPTTYYPYGPTKPPKYPPIIIPSVIKKPSRKKNLHLIILPRFPGTKKSKRPLQIFKQPTKYQPSFTASILNIRAKKAPLLAPGALSVRPVIPKLNVI